MAVVKREPNRHTAKTTASIEPTQQRPTRQSRRDSSVATIVEGSMPYRASSVLSQAAANAPPTPADTSHASNGTTTPADGDVEMLEDPEPASDAMEKLGQRSRSLIQIIQKLSAFNIDTTLPSLPKIILIGDQSAGKSSVIEALCDIKMPRSEGTCTRCPFHLTTTSSITGSSGWACKISILTKFAFVPSVQAARDGEQYDQWQKQKDSSTAQFAVIYQKEHLDQALRRAQLAVLNPGQDYSNFMNTSVDSRHRTKNQVDFSPNIVCLEIASPNLPELSFYDLPGAINSMGDENDQYLVKFVETLLKSYIRDENATVLLACAANQDIETSTAVRYLNECRIAHGKARGDRAIGVLTKPDLVDDNPEKIAGINKIMRGSEFRMNHGWYVTKQLSQKQLTQGITHEQARRAESEFFAAGPWAEEDLAAYQGRFGTSNLQAALSQILTTHILHELPGIVARVKDRLSEVDQDLAMFPAQDAAPTFAIIQAIDALKSSILSELNADGVSDFRKTCRQVNMDMPKRLTECRPTVELSTPGYVKQSIPVDSSDEESPTKKIKAKPNNRASVAPGRTPTPLSTPGSSTNDRRRKVPGSNTPAVRPASTRFQFKLDEVKRSFDSAPGADLPGGISNIVIGKLNLETLGGWKVVLNKVVKTVKDAFERMLTDSLNKALAARHATLLFKQASKIVHALFNEIFTEEMATITRILARETYRTISQAAEPLEHKKIQHQAELQARRLKLRVQEHFEDLEGQGFKVTEADIEKRSKDAAWALENLGPDVYHREVEQLATPLAYYDVASMQLCDTIVRELEYGLFHEYEVRLHSRLLDELRAGDAAYCAELLAEDPARERERVALLVEQDKLQQALKELNSLPDAHA